MRYGRIDIETHARHLQLTGERLAIYIFGRDVTDWCTFADDNPREPFVLLIPKDGEIVAWILAHGGLWEGSSIMRLRGEVSIWPEVWPSALSAQHIQDNGPTDADRTATFGRTQRAITVGDQDVQ